jgi:multidrug efflux pump subunit AcrB
MLWGRTRFVFLALAIALAASVTTIVSAPQSLFPDISLARVEVFADAGDLPSEAVRTSVAVPLERVLATLPGLRATRTYADPGKLELELDFDPHGRPDDDLRAVRAAIADVRAGLPVSRVVTVVEGPEAEPVVTYAIVSQAVGQAELARRVDGAIARAFVGVPDLGRLTVFGGPRVAYDVSLDPARLRAHGLTARDVATAIAAANEPRVAGTIVRGLERFSVISGGTISDATTLGAIAVAGRDGRQAATLRALGAVRRGDEETGRQASFDATHAVLLNAYLVPRGDATALASGIAARVPRLRDALPSDARITVAWDQTRPIEDAQHALRIEMLLGALIAIGAIALFLRDGALVLASAVVLPIALAFTVVILVRSGLRLDLMSLGGLAIAIGLIVDETIVVVEAIARALDANPSLPRRAAIGSAVRRIARPLAASTLANAVVFVPLAFLGGVPGFFFRALAITLVVALVVSIALSLWIAPLLAETLRARARRRTTESHRIERAYVGYVRFALRRRAFVFAAGLAIAAISVAMLLRTPTGFLPRIDEGQFEIKYALPPGTSLAAADETATAFEREVLNDPAVSHVARLSGIDTNGYLATPPDAGTLRVTLKDGARRGAFDPIAERMRIAVRNVEPSTAVEVHQLLEDQINDLSGAPEPVQLVVSGPSQTTLATIAGTLADAVAQVRGVTDVFDGVTWQARSVRATPRDGGPADAAFADELAARVHGIHAADVAAADGPIPILVREGSRPALERIASLDAPLLASTVQEADGERVVRVTGDLEDRDLSAVTADIERRIAPIVRALPSGYRVTVDGAVVAQRAAFAEFATVFAIALVLVFGVLVAAFDSFRLPLVVLATVPLTPIGVAVTLALAKTPLNVASFMGMLLLVGIVVRSGILLVDSANRRVREGATASDAMERAATERLRPILMTTLATLGALAPIAFGLGAGSELERPLAIAVIGGIVAATALTLAIVPALYVATAPRVKEAFARETTA